MRLRETHRASIPSPGLFASLGLSVVSLGLLAAPAAAGTDPRFFGTYCGDDSIEHCVKVKIKVLGITVREERRCENFELKDIKIALEHHATAFGGIVSGRGAADIRGERLPFVMSGVVARTGLVRGTATASGFSPRFGRATLSPDGLELTLRSHNKRLTARKDQCGNSPPRAEIVAFPSGPLAYGKPFIFRGEASDAEDLSFPAARLNWRHDGDEPLVKSSSGLTARLPVLLPGEHDISFDVTDSGGLTTTASRRLTITNTPPKRPRIVLPRDSSTVRAGCDLNFVGRAYDDEEGFLDGPALRWRSSVDGELGEGAALTGSLASPGSHTIELRAVDSVGASSRTSIALEVRDAVNGCPPRARIVTPEHEKAEAWVIDGTTPTLFVGTADDGEDAPDQLSMRWEGRPINPSGPTIALGTGSTIETSDLVVIRNQVTEYEVSFIVTDSDNNTAADRMRLVVLGYVVQ